MEEWKEYKLIDVLEALIDYRGKTPKKVDSGIPLITAKIVKGGRINEPNEFLAEEDYDKWMVRGFPKAGDVVLTTEAPLGEVAQLDNRKIALAQRIVTLRGKKNVLDNTYLKYYFLSNIGQSRLKARETGTTVTGIKQSELREVLVTCPTFPTQQKIANILSSLDDKIEVNRRINEQLEELAGALFNRMFFENNELDRLPLSSFANINPTRYLSKGTEARYIEMANLPTKGSFPMDWSLKSYEGGMKFTNGDTIMARITPCLENGKTAYIDFLDENEIAFGSTEYIVISAKENFCPALFYFLARNKDFVDYAVGHMNGSSGRQRVSGADIANFLMPNISIEDSNRFAEIAMPIMDVIKNNSLENRHLTALRDTLLPKLMSGEIDVNEVKI